MIREFVTELTVRDVAVSVVVPSVDEASTPAASVNV